MTQTNMSIETLKAGDLLLFDNWSSYGADYTENERLPVLILEVIDRVGNHLVTRFLYPDGTIGIWRLNLPYLGASHYELMDSR